MSYGGMYESSCTYQAQVKGFVSLLPSKNGHAVSRQTSALWFRSLSSIRTAWPGTNIYTAKLSVLTWLIKNGNTDAGPEFKHRFIVSFILSGQQR